MPYVAEISRANPTCFLFLMDQSGSMADALAGESGKKKADKVADVLNRFLQNLVIKCGKNDGVRNYFHVGVIGYGASVGPAFAGTMRWTPKVGQGAKLNTKEVQHVEETSFVQRRV